MIMDNPGDLNERVAALEVHVENLHSEVQGIRVELKGIHGRINKMITNDFAEFRRGRRFWLQVFGAGGIGAIIIEAFIRYILPRIFGV